MSFQSSIQIRQGFGVPGEVFQDVPWTVLSYTLNSSGTPNVIGSTAYTVSGYDPAGSAVVEAGNGGAYGFAGILAIPKDYALTGIDGDSLSPTLELPDETQAEIVSQGMMVVHLPSGTVNIGDFIIYNNTTGTLDSMAPSAIIPDGYSSANAIVSQFSQDIAFGGGLAVIQIFGSGTGSSSIFNNWPYVDTYWLASNGQDTLPGNNPNLPNATLLQIAGEISGPTVINIDDNGTYLLPSTFSYAFPVLINAPNATIQYSAAGGGTTSAFQSTVNTASLVINCALLDGGSTPPNRFFSGLGNVQVITKATARLGQYFWFDTNLNVSEAIFYIGTTDASASLLRFGAAGTQILKGGNLDGLSVTSTRANTTGSCELEASYFNGTLGGSNVLFNVNFAMVGPSYTVATSSFVTVAGKQGYLNTDGSVGITSGLTTGSSVVNTATFAVGATALGLGSVNLLLPNTSSGQFQITNIVVLGTGSSNFAGGGGDRNIILTDGTNTWTTLAEAFLTALDNEVWGSTDVPFPTGSTPINVSSVAGADIVLEYSGGTTNYASGNLFIRIDYIRVTN
jgi:hypothetical protein